MSVAELLLVSQPRYHLRKACGARVRAKYELERYSVRKYMRMNHAGSDAAMMYSPLQGTSAQEPPRQMEKEPVSRETNKVSKPKARETTAANAMMCMRRVGIHCGPTFDERKGAMP